MTTDKAPQTNDLWRPFRHFLGSWAGTGTGEPGVSSVERTYSLTLAGRFIEVRNRSVYDPQKDNPSGEVHEDLGMISYDKARAQYILREFYLEGFVNQYVLEPFTPGDMKLTLVTEAIENIAPGWRARHTLEILSQDSFRETFDLAAPGQPWACYVTNEFHRPF